MEGPRTPSAFYKMISIPEAQQVVLQETHSLAAREADLAGALGNVLAEEVKASEPLPPFPASIKDGYAVVLTDGVGEYEVAFEALAGSAQGQLQPGTVAYISTGAAIPRGADAVVQVEDTAVISPAGPSGKARVHIKKQAASGEDIRPVGSDIAAGETVLAAGEVVGAAEVGLLATVGATHVQVYRQPRVAVLSTGDELAEPSTSQLAPGQIRDANRPMLLAATAQAGAVTLDLGIVPDAAGEAGLEAVFDSAIAQGADVIITSGGVSMGDKDFVKPVLERRARVFFGKVCMKPGKPLTFATITVPADDSAPARLVLLFGLPGNPVSSLVTFNLVVLPALRKLAGWQAPQLRRVHARIAAPLALDPVRPEYHRAALRWAAREGGAGPLDGEWAAHSTGGQISSRLLSMRSANALLELPQANGMLPAGSMVSALLIGDLGTIPEPKPPAVTPKP